jgi:electron transfer flavoprotein alpha subunit
VVKEIIAKTAGKIDVSEADIIVSGGRGVKGPEGFAVLEELAGLLGAAVGASRTVVDEGGGDSDWDCQTGSSFKLYIAWDFWCDSAFGGQRTSKCIVAINKDPEAPIFSTADYGIVGDLFKVVPALTAEIKKTIG